MSQYHVVRPNDRRDFRIAIICALTIEADMVESVFDNEWHHYGKAAGDPNTYSTGVIAGHNVVLAYCSSLGSNSATHIAMGLRSSFTGIKIAFIVGMCGATHFNSSTETEIYLGDCIVSTAVVQYDLGRHGPGGFQKKDGLDNLARAGIEVRSMITKFKTQKNTLELERGLASHLQQLQNRDPERTRYPGKHTDRLFEASYVHRHQLPNETCEMCNSGLGICSKDCEQLGCDESQLVNRKAERNSSLPKIHFGAYGSANTVLKSGVDRDKLTKSDGLIAFEMEASGVWEVYPTILIKAACDYADSHKNKKWQGYAASVAAACLKAFIEKLELSDEEAPTPSIAREQASRMSKNKDFTSIPVERLETMASMNSGDIKEMLSTNIVPFSLPYLEAENYVDRPQETETLQRWLIHNTTPIRSRARLFTIHGLGGIGKTQLMLNYAGLHRHDYTAILWFNGSSHTAFRQSFIDNARKIPSTRLRGYATKLSKSQKAFSQERWGTQKDEEESRNLLDELISAMMSWLNSPGNTDWLLLFDNVDRRFPSDTDSEAFDIFAYIRLLVHGSIIMTTRYLPYCRQPMTLTLDSMTEDQALRCLASGTGQDLEGLPQDAKDLVNTLGRLPLALSHASSFIFQNGYTFYQYLSVYRVERLNLMSQDPYSSFASDYSNGSVATTWMLSYNHIKSHEPLSAEFLQMLAYFQCNDIAFEIFKGDKEASADEYIKKWANPPKLVKHLYSFMSFTTLIQPLVAYAFLYPRASGLGGFRMHPLIQDWCLFISTPKESYNHFISVLQILELSLEKASGIRGGLLQRHLQNRFRNHGLRCLEMLSSNIEAEMNKSSDSSLTQLRVLIRLCSLVGNHHSTIALTRRVLEGFKKENSLRDETTRELADTLAWELIRNKNYKEAEFILNEILSSYDTVEVEQSNLYISLTLKLAKTYMNSDSSVDTDTLIKQITQSMSTRNGLKISEMIWYKIQIGRFLSQQHHYEEAMRVYSGLLVAHTEWDDSAKALCELALEHLTFIYNELNRSPEAVAMLEDFLFNWEKTHGHDDGFRFVILRLLGHAYFDSEQWDKSENTWRKLGENPGPCESENYRLEAQLHIGECLHEKKCLAEAEAVFRAVLERQVKFLGDTALDTAETRYRLGLVLQDQGHLTLAEDLFRKAISDRKNDQGDSEALIVSLAKVPEDEIVLTYISALGYNLVYQDRLVEGRTILEKVLEIYTSAFDMNGSSVFYVPSVQGFLASVYWAQTDYAAAEIMARQSFQGGVERFGRNHKRTLFASEKLAQILRILERYEDAEALLREDLAIKMSNNDKSDVFRMLKIQGNMYWNQEKYEEAKLPYRRLLTVHPYDGTLFTRRSFLIRGGVARDEWPKYLRLCVIASSRKVAEQHEPSKAYGVICDGCNTQLLVSQQNLDRSYHCWNCFDVDFCDTCFQSLQSGVSFPVCSQRHRFLEVSNKFWSFAQAPAYLLDEQGVTATDWLKKIRDDFYEDMRRDDAAWMEWADALSENTQLQVYTGLEFALQMHDI